MKIEMRDSMKTLGMKISELRKNRKMTQDELANEMGVSSQAVSKWENDLSIPDLPILISLADFFHVSLDELVREKQPEVVQVPKEERKSISELFLRIHVIEKEGDSVKINLPLSFVKTMYDMGVDLSKVTGNSSFSSVDLGMLIRMVEEGLQGKLLDIGDASGDHIEIIVGN